MTKQMVYFGFHAFQSFAKGEVTPEIAHQIGIRLANELWGDRFEVVVTTHLNTNCIHNHFCLNSVSFKDGKKYYDTHASYALMRETSDRLCEEYNLIVLKEKRCPKSNIDYSKFYQHKAKQTQYCSEVKEDIDYAIGQADEFNEFITIMKKLNYEVTNRYGRLSVRPLNRKRPIRIERAFGNDYQIENINNRILTTHVVKVPFPEARTLKGKYKSKTKLKNKRKITGIRALYFHYCYLLKIYPSRTKRVMSKELREDIKKMDRLSNEARFLSKGNIQTAEELLKNKESTIKKLSELQGTRDYKYKKRKKAKTIEEREQFQNEINVLNREIKNLREEKAMIEEIELRIPKIKENVKEIYGKKKLKQREIEETERRHRN